MMAGPVKTEQTQSNATLRWKVSMNFDYLSDWRCLLSLVVDKMGSWGSCQLKASSRGEVHSFCVIIIVSCHTTEIPLVSDN